MQTAMTEVSYCAIAALVGEPLKAGIVELSGRCEREHGSWYVLSAEKFPPHLTLWIAYIPAYNLNSLQASFRKCAAKAGRFSVQIDKFEIEDSGFVTLRVRVNEDLQRIHALFLANLNDVRDGYIPPKYAAKLDSFPDDQRRSISEFGTRFAGSLFSPHLTIAVVKPDEVVKARTSLVAPRGTSFDVDALTLFRQGEEGRSIEILDQVTL